MKNGDLTTLVLVVLFIAIVFISVLAVLDLLP